MKKFFRLFIILFIILAVLLTGGYVYLVVKGKDMIVSRLEKQLGKKVSFNSVASPTATIKIDGITSRISHGQARSFAELAVSCSRRSIF